MAFSLKTRKVGSVVVLDMRGQLSIGEPVLLFRTTIRRFMEDGSRHFLLNLSEVSKMDSSGVGELITSFASVRNRQGDVKLVKLSAATRDLLQTTKLVTVFDTYEEEEKAVAAFS